MKELVVKRFLKGIMFCFLLMMIIPAMKASAAEKSIKLDVNKEYFFSEIKPSWGNTYTFTTDIPKDGRIKIVLEDCYSNLIQDYWGFLDEGESSILGNVQWKTVSEERLESGWITVKAGENGYGVIANNTLNREAKIIIQYETKEQFIGELEDNDTYDTATEIELNTVYEGNYSKYKDVDIYKLTMEKAGLVEFQSSKNLYYVLYEEDLNGNVFEIAQNVWVSNRKQHSDLRVRLAAGTYFIKMRVDDWENNYTICSKVTYEADSEYEQEKNNVASKANQKITNRWYTGHLNDSKDIDYYKIKIERESYLAVEFRIPRQTKRDMLKISLRDSNLKILTEASNTENPYLKTSELRLPAGYYYVRVEKGSRYDVWNDVYDSSNTGPFLEDYSFCLTQRPYIYVSGITLLSNKDMTVGQEIALSPVISPNNATNKTIKWSSSNPSIVGVSSNGKTVAKSKGTAIIKATAGDGSGKQASCKIRVGITIAYHLKGGKNHSGNPKSYFENNSFTLKNPTRAGYIFKGWYIDETMKKQIRQITTSNKKNLILYAKWEKRQPPKVKSLKVNTTYNKIAPGKKTKMSVTVYPNNAGNKSVKWKSSNNRYAKVSANGMVTTKKSGKGKTVTITAIAKDGSGVKKSVKIKIMKGSVKKIKLKAPKTLKVGKKIKVKPVVIATKGANKKLKYNVNNRNVSINSKGVLKASKKAKGKLVRITAKSTDGTSKKAIIKIKIK